MELLAHRIFRIAVLLGRYVGSGRLDDAGYTILTVEELALMEAVCEAAVNNSVCVCGKVWRYENHAHAENCPVTALAAYRERRGHE